jgi:hypothetical protein
MKNFFMILSIILVTAGFTVSCTEDIPECPTKLCVIAGGWKLVEVTLDGERYTGDISNFQLTLHNPGNSDDISSSFERITVGGIIETGTWSVENVNPDSRTPFKGSVLRLTPSSSDLSPENWNIESFTPRQMILVLYRDTTVKDGPAIIRYILEPF